MNTERDQGQPVEEPDDIDEDGDDAASEPEDTVKEDSQSLPVATGEETVTEPEGTGTDPFEELLKQEKYVPRKDYEHATRKITEQGQQLSARDTEITKLHQELAALRRDLTGESTEAENGQSQPTPAVGDAGLQQRIGLIEEALLEVYDNVKRRETLEKTSKRLGTRPEMAERITDLLAEGRTEDALDLAGQVAILQYDQKLKEKAESPPPKVMSGGGASRKPVPEPLKPEDLPEDLQERKNFHFKRLRKAFGFSD